MNIKLSMYMYRYYLFIILIISLWACKNSPLKTENKDSYPKSARLKYHLELSVSHKSIPIGHNLECNVKFIDSTAIKPILKIFVNDSLLNIDTAYSSSFVIKTDDFKTGNHKIGVMAYSDSNILLAQEEKKIILLSDIKPNEYTVIVTKTYPHDIDAYTQGLEFCNDFLYEGTGQKGKSSIRKTNYETGEILQNSNLDKQFFGEGISILKDKLYQLTWESNVGFVYDVETLKKINEFNYPTEGWGLANDGQNLWMSDGTENIYIIDPTNFNQIKKVEVYNNEKPVIFLNELEWIDGKLFANIYQTNKIVIIDPQTGKVLANIDASVLETLLPDSPNRDVLNGIAYHKNSKGIFLTGKRWPRLFEVQLKQIK